MTKKQGLRLVLFVMVLGIVLCAMISVFDIPAEGDTLNIKKRYNDFYDEPENTWDCVLVGTSCVDREWVAPLAWKNYGMTVYAMNTDVQPMYLTTNVLKEIRKRQNVKLTVVDIRGIRMDSLQPDEIRIRRVTDSMKPSKNRWDAVTKGIEFYKDYYSRENVENGEKKLEQLDEMSMYFPFLKYHSRWETGLYYADFHEPVSEMKGVYDFEDIPFTVKELSPTKVVTDVEELNDIQKSVLDEIIEYGDRTGLEILFISSPSKLDKKEQPEINAAIQYLEEKGQNIINYNTHEMYEDIGLDFKEDLYNWHHLNSKGAVKFTEYFSRYLKDNYQFEDKRGKEGYEEWDEAYEKYMEFYEKGWK